MLKKCLKAVFAALLLFLFVAAAMAAAEHEHIAGGTVITVIKEPTCAEEGAYQETIYCAICGTEMESVTKTIGKTQSHVSQPPVKENLVPATCATEGTYDNVIYCKVCGAEIQRVIGIIPRLTSHLSEYALKRTVSRGENGRTVVTFDDPAYQPLTKYGELPENCDGATVEAGRYLLGDGGERTCADGVECCAVCGELISQNIPHVWDKGESVASERVIKYTCLICGTTHIDYLEGPNIKNGDVDCDGAVTAADARFVLRYSVGLGDVDKIITTDVLRKVADYDQDGKVAPADARLILRVSVGLRIE